MDQGREWLYKEKTHGRGNKHMHMHNCTLQNRGPRRTIHEERKAKDIRIARWGCISGFPHLFFFFFLVGVVCRRCYSAGVARGKIICEVCVKIDRYS